jgi:hypothetical protein
MAQAPPPRRAQRACYNGLTAFLALTVVGGLSPPPSLPAAVTPAAPRELGSFAVESASPLDEPLRLLEEARKSYDAVDDYSCVLVKRERLDGRLGEEQTACMKVRARPFSVSLRWQQPRELAGQEACYVAGRNGGKMRAKSAGLLGAVGFVSMEPDDARARAASRHSITEAGIGNLLDRYKAAWEEERTRGGTVVRMGESEYNKRRCVRVETVRAVRDELAHCHTSVVYFDKETRLPIRVECYDWPQDAGERGELLECYSYAHLRLNVGLGDDVFDR